jgi:hypothetical protein
VPLRTEKDALAWLARHRVATLVPRPSGLLPSVVGEVVGGAVRGSWWAHPEGKRIFRLASAIGDSPDALVMKLIAGKVTFVHRSLWAPLLRVVTDPNWAAARRKALHADGRSLVTRVVKEGELRVDEIAWPAARRTRAKDAVEKSLLVHASQVHTKSGKHTTVLMPWGRWVTPAVLEEVRAWTFEDAWREVLGACQGEAAIVNAPVRRRS